MKVWGKHKHLIHNIVPTLWELWSKLMGPTQWYPKCPHGEYKVFFGVEMKECWWPNRWASNSFYKINFFLNLYLVVFAYMCFVHSLIVIHLQILQISRFSVIALCLLSNPLSLGFRLVVKAMGWEQQPGEMSGTGISCWPRVFHKRSYEADTVK